MPACDSQPNILIVFVDQLRADILACYGGGLCRTPVLDRLAATSTVFERAYTPTAVCSPARASLLTGKYPHNNAVVSNAGQVFAGVLRDSPTLLSRRLEALGYDRAYFGKWHLGGEDNLPKDVGLPGHQCPGHGEGGYDYPAYREYLAERGLEFALRDPRRHPGRYGTLAGPAEAEVSAFLVHDAISFLDRWDVAGRRNPFFCWVNFWGPHEPYYPTADYLAMYDGVEIPPWPNFGDTSPDRPGIHRLKMPGAANGWDFWEPAVRHYLAFMTLIDAQIGRLLDRLRALDVAEDTVIVFAADHGQFLGSHGMGDKGHAMYEEIYRIPLMIRLPGRAPRREERLVSTVDLCPTLLDLAGDTDPHAGRDGRSLLPLLDGTATQWRSTVAAEFHGLVTAYTQRMITDGRYKYVWNIGDVEELYDLDSDPHELANLATDPDAATQLRRLRKALEQWMVDTGDEALGYFRNHQRKIAGSDAGVIHHEKAQVR